MTSVVPTDIDESLPMAISSKESVNWDPVTPSAKNLGEMADSCAIITLFSPKRTEGEICHTPVISLPALRRVLAPRQLLQKQVAVLSADDDDNSMASRLQGVQVFISCMSYNLAPHGKPHFNNDKKRRYCDIMETARAMLAQPQAIKCLEAVMLALHMTNSREYHSLDRVPVGFKTTDTFTGHDYRHIILAVRDNASGTWGSLGLSRDVRLMWKPLIYPSIGALLTDYQSSYLQISHSVLKVRIGLPVPHNENLRCKVVWRAIKLRTENSSTWDTLCAAADLFTETMCAEAKAVYILSKQVGSYNACNGASIDRY